MHVGAHSPLASEQHTALCLVFTLVLRPQCIKTFTPLQQRGPTRTLFIPLAPIEERLGGLPSAIKYRPMDNICTNTWNF